MACGQDLKKLKIVFFIATIISAIIWATSTIADLHEEKRDIQAARDSLEFEIVKLKSAVESFDSIGQYGSETIIDTVYEWLPPEIIDGDTVYVIDTIEVLGTVKFVEFDTSKTFKWAEQSITIRAAGKLYTESKYRRLNYLMIQPTKWIFTEPDPVPIIQFANMKAKYGIGLMATNEIYGAYFRIRSTRLGITSEYKDLSFGAYLGYEILSF